MITNYKFRKKISSKSPLSEYPGPGPGPGTAYNFYNSYQSRRSPSASKNSCLYLNRRHQLMNNQGKSKESYSGISSKLKTSIRPSSQGTKRIFNSSVYLTDPISNFPFVFEVDLLKTTTEVIHQVGSSASSSIDKLYSTFQASKDEKNLRSQNSSIYRKINIEKFKETEKIAAIIIQACWRGFKTRKLIQDLKKAKTLEKAEAKARNAIKEYEDLKLQMQRLRRSQNN